MYFFSRFFLASSDFWHFEWRRGKSFFYRMFVTLKVIIIFSFFGSSAAGLSAALVGSISAGGFTFWQFACRSNQLIFCWKKIMNAAIENENYCCKSKAKAFSSSIHVFKINAFINSHFMCAQFIFSPIFYRERKKIIDHRHKNGDQILFAVHLCTRHPDVNHWLYYEQIRKSNGKVVNRIAIL